MSKVEDIRKEYEAKLAQAKREDELTALIPAGGRLCMYKLFGSVAGVSYGDNLFGQDKATTWEQAKELIAKLPPVDLTLVKNGCTSFQPTSYVESLPEDHRDRGKEESPVSPVLLQIEAFQGPYLRLEWYARLANGELIHVRCNMGYLFSHRIGTYTAKRREHTGGYTYESAKFSPNAELHTIHGEEPIAQLESPIRWASGGPEYPNNMTLYFCNLGADMDPAMVGRAMVDYIAKLASAK